MGQRTSDYTIFTLDPDSVFPRISDQSDSLMPSDHTMDTTMSQLLNRREIKYQYQCYKPLKSLFTDKRLTFVNSSLFQVPDPDSRF